MSRFVSQEGRDKRFLIQKLCQAQSLSATRSPVFKSQPRSRSGGSPSYHTSFSSNFSEAVFLAHPPPDSSTHVWDRDFILQTKNQMQYWTDALELKNKWIHILTFLFVLMKTQHGNFCGLVLPFQRSFLIITKTIKCSRVSKPKQSYLVRYILWCFSYCMFCLTSCPFEKDLHCH